MKELAIYRGVPIMKLSGFVTTTPSFFIGDGGDEGQQIAQAKIAIDRWIYRFSGGES